MPFIFATDKVSFHITEEKLVVTRRDRKDLPHLTICFKTASKQLDIHLKYQDNRESPYVSILRHPIEDIMHAIAQIYEPKRMQKFWQSRSFKVRPGWLKKNGYHVHWMDEEEFLPKLNEQITWNKKRKRYDIGNIESFFRKKLPAVLKDSWYQPAILHYLPYLTTTRPIQAQAVCDRKRAKPRLSLFYDETTGWVAINPNHSSALIEQLKSYLNEHLPIISKIYHEIWQGLALEELGIEDPLIVAQRRMGKGVIQSL